jgi:hypothetical protein
MKKFLIALAMSLPLFARASDGKIVSDKVGIEPQQKIRVEMDKGTLTVAPSASESLTYEVEFVLNQPGSGLFRIFDRKVPSPKDCEQCTATYSVETGLVIHSGEDFNAIAKIGIPVKQPLAVTLSAGRIDLGPLTGKIEALLGAGTLRYDASALPSDICVDASVKSGSAHNTRDTNCKSIGVTLRTQTGKVSVE